MWLPRTRYSKATQSAHSGAGVITNMYAMSKDASMYPDPESFKPERFLTPSGALSPNFADIAFGFGRRVCPGRYLSDASVWIAMASVLSCFRIGKAIDAQGKDIEVVPRYKPGLAIHPEKFDCSFTCRSEEWRKVIEVANTV